MFRFLFIYMFCIFSLYTNAHSSIDSVRLQLKWHNQFQFAGYYAAIEKGFYKELNLNVILRNRQPEEGYISPVLNGKAEYGVADISLLLHNKEKYKPLLLAQIYQHSPLILISKSDSGILSPYDMVGKKVMYDEDDISMTAMFMGTIETLSKLTIIPHKMGLKDFISGKVDVISAYITNEPFLLKQQGINVNIISPRNYNIDFYGDNLFTTQKELREHPERVKKMIKATIKGWAYALSHKNEMINLILKKYNPNLSRSVLEYEAEMTKRMISPKLFELGKIDANKFRKIIKLFYKFDMIKFKTLSSDFLYPQMTDNYKKENKSKLNLSDQEKQWLKEHPVIRVGTDMDWAPIEYYDKATNMYQGVSIDTLDILSQKLGIQFKILKGFTWKQLLDKAKKKELDMFSCITKTAERTSYLKFTNPYLSSPVVIFSDNRFLFIDDMNQLNNKKVAIVNGYSIQGFLKEYFPKIQIISVKNIDEGMTLLNNKKVSGYIDDQLVGSFYITRNGYDNFKIAGKTSFTAHLSMAVRKDWVIFHKIISKALQNISYTKHNAIYNKWVSIKYVKADYTLIWEILLGLAIFVILFILWNLNLRREVKKRTRELTVSKKQLSKLLDEKEKDNLQLIEKETELSTIYQKIPSIIFVVDSNAIIIKANQIALSYFSIENESIIGKPIGELFSCIHAFEDEQGCGFADECSTCNIRDMVNSRTLSSPFARKEFSLMVKRNNVESQLHVMMSSSLLGEKKEDSLLICIDDITEVKALQHEALQSQKMEAMGTLAGGIAHDFNNILGTMLGYIELTLFNLEGNKKVTTYLEKVLTAGERAKQLIKQILLFSSRSQTENTSIQVNIIAEEVADFLKEILPHNIQFIKKLSKDILPVFANKTQIYQILVNLCTNAAHAMEAKGGNLTLGVFNKELELNDFPSKQNVLPGYYVCMSISDTGTGIKPAIINRIFEPYFTTKGQGKGTGMGLAIVNGIITSYQGFIHVDSKEDKGTTFSIYIPATYEQTNSEQTPKIETIPKGSEHILVIDDEEMLATMDRSILTNLGYKVTLETEPDKALNRFRKNPNSFDLIISDHAMPIMTGIELAKEIIKIKNNIPIIICTGYCTPEMKIEAKDIGIKKLIIKPYSYSEFANIVRNVLNEN